MTLPRFNTHEELMAYFKLERDIFWRFYEIEKQLACIRAAEWRFNEMDEMKLARIEDRLRQTLRKVEEIRDAVGE